ALGQRTRGEIEGLRTGSAGVVGPLPLACGVLTLWGVATFTRGNSRREGADHIAVGSSSACGDGPSAGLRTGVTGASRTSLAGRASIAPDVVAVAGRAVRSLAPGTLSLISLEIKGDLTCGGLGRLAFTLSAIWRASCNPTGSRGPLSRPAVGS
ncbi:MAG: hypothetical protein PVH17_09945, partial [Anaerolineae bacterium]